MVKLSALCEWREEISGYCVLIILPNDERTYRTVGTGRIKLTCTLLEYTVLWFFRDNRVDWINHLIFQIFIKMFATLLWEIMQETKSCTRRKSTNRLAGGKTSPLPPFASKQLFRGLLVSGGFQYVFDYTYYALFIINLNHIRLCCIAAQGPTLLFIWFVSIAVDITTTLGLPTLLSSLVTGWLTSLHRAILFQWMIGSWIPSIVQYCCFLQINY